MIIVKQSVLHRVEIDVQRSRLPIRKDILSCEHGMHITSLLIVVYATYEPPDEEALVPMDAEEVKPPSLEQARVAEALLRRTKRMLGEPAFKAFKEVQFLICVPAFTTLQAQTAYRVRKAGLLDRERNEDEYSKVVMNTAGATGNLIFTAFKLRAQREPETLFIIIADECHYAPTRGGAQDKYINDELMLKKLNVVVLLISATPFNCLTKTSRIVDPDVSKACNALELESTHDDPTSNSLWRRKLS
ncbi:MAG: hypothetical protein SGPRY_011340 [Prymnesium sp.]